MPSKPQSEQKAAKFGEPWHTHGGIVLCQSDGSSIGEMSIGFPDVDQESIEERNAARAIACVNAMTPISDPASFVERAKRIEEAAQLKRNTSITDDHGFEGTWVAVPHEDFMALRTALNGGK